MMGLWRLFVSFASLLCAAGAASAQPAAFHSSDEAKAWLARELPRLTAANPAYRTKSDGTVSQWLTKAVSFSRDAKGHVNVAMEESYTQTKAGVTTPGTHKAAFSLADVDISDLTGADDVTPSGEPSRGVLFRCKTSGCIAAVWGGKASRGDKTDISIQDDDARGKVLMAFRYLASHSN